LYKAARKKLPKIKIKDVKKFLSKQQTYTLHKPIRRKFPRNKIVTAGLDVDWQADLADFSGIKKHNNNYTFVLVCIDVLSRYIWAVPIKRKTGDQTAAALQTILDQGRRPWRLCTDRGREFKNQTFQDLLKKHDIQYFNATSPDVKAAMAEIYIRHLKNRLYKYFTKMKTFRYLDVLPRIVDAMNRSVCRTTGMAPANVNKENAESLWQKLYGKPLEKKPFHYDVGDKVRITKEKHKLSKGYVPNFTEEVFVITECLNRIPPTYKLHDLSNESIDGVFYESELVKVLDEDKPTREIEKVIKTEKRDDNVWYFVKFKNEPVKNNKWINEHDLVTI
jgi:hypothetical protein